MINDVVLVVCIRTLVSHCIAQDCEELSALVYMV